jgi:uncharacterized glyoxalase superfamily protein PhnB
MAEQNLPDQLNELIDRLLANNPMPGGELEPLLAIAADLRNMPSPQFKARLKTELERKTNMSAAVVVTPIPRGFHTVTPYLIAKQGAEMIDFVKQAFGAEETFRTVGSAGGLHAELRIGDSMLMMGGGLAYQGPDAPAALHYYVKENPDEIYRRALQAGATSLVEPMEDYGERFAVVRDAYANEWIIARRLGPEPAPEGLHSIAAYFHPVGAPKFIDFLTQAFGAETVVRHDSPEGIVHHAKLRIGGSIVELGEAHGQWQYMPMSIYLYVPNVDEVYRNAITAGATSLNEPTDHPYGDRGAGVKDAWGHTWYIATHIKEMAP